MVAAQSAAHFFAVATQTTALRTPMTTGFTFIQGKAGGLALERPSKASDELCHYEQHFMRAQNSSVTGSLPLLLYYNQIGQFLDNFLHRVTTGAGPFSHLWTPHPTAQFEDNQAKGLTLLDGRDYFVYRATGCMINSLAVAYAESDPHSPGMTFGVKGCTLERIPVVIPTISTDVPANPEGNFTLNVIANGHTHSAYPVKNFNLTITPAVDMRWQLGDMYPVRAVHTGKITGAATFAWDLENDDSSGGSGVNLNEDWEEVWLDSDDTVSIELVHTGEGGESMTILLPAMRPTGGTSQAALGTIEAPFAATSQYDIANDQAGIQITITGSEVLP